VRVASVAPTSIEAFFGPLFGSKRNKPTANVGESPLTPPGQTKSQAADATPSTAPPPIRAAASNQEKPEAQRTQEPTPGPLPDDRGARPANLLAGALPIVPAGSFESRFGAWR
jgi:hypothetical protein